MEAKKPTSSGSRRVKNPETFRERAIKVSDAQDNAKDSYRLLKAPFKAIGIVFRPLKSGVKQLEKVPALKPIFFVLSLIGRIIVPKYVRTSFVELKKVTWPSIRQSLKLTYAVLAFAIVFGSAIAILDYGLDKVFKQILLK